MLQNNILKIPIGRLGYGFISEADLPEGKDEYYLRNLQNRNGIVYRQLTAYEIEVLVRNGNTSDNWNNILVSDAFNPELVKSCKFFGLVRIGKLEPYFLEYSKLKVPVGLYHSTIISCDFGDNVVVDNVNYMSHYIIGSEAIIVNVNELMTTPHAKFGIGILKKGEPEDIRIWMELANENGGRKVIPFNGMLPGDAWLWAKYRDNPALLQRFIEFTEKQFDTKKGFYGKIGDRTVIKNCAIIKDVWIGSDAYLKGANKLKNLTINSKPGAKTQIGEGCEMVNGIVGFGCRAFYGVKAVRFVMSSNAQLKYGARLINAYLGDNATISCCEVLNSLIFPAHEQHHNNSFLCASVIMGQSNMAAGATIGSNHNSRANDGEIQANRGFWPGLCVSLKHNSRFASFTIMAKGDYPAELDIALPFSLVSQQTPADRLLVMPGYWFMYNMYALGRNTWKYIQRDKRPDKVQLIEYDYLAPDTANEILAGISLLENFTGKALVVSRGEDPDSYTAEALQKTGRQLLMNAPDEADKLEVLATGFENSQRKVQVLKAGKAYHIYRQLLVYYTATQVQVWCKMHKINTLEAFAASLPARLTTVQWQNIGGQLIPETDVQHALKCMVQQQIDGWEALHQWYREQGESYAAKKALHSFAVYRQLTGKSPGRLSAEGMGELLNEGMATRIWLAKQAWHSRAKDYDNPFKKMLYSTEAEMEAVLGKLEDNEYLQWEQEAMLSYKKQTAAWKRKLK
ncbi:MAG: DUF4954 family protein [Chitinophagaceae bacterium]|jgi:hypothetical protein|nr:DUF4954 family protein [Chitinophagaceae bacterium]